MQIFENSFKLSFGFLIAAAAIFGTEQLGLSYRLDRLLAFVVIGSIAMIAWHNRHRLPFKFHRQTGAASMFALASFLGENIWGYLLGLIAFVATIVLAFFDHLIGDSES
ncbi:hypothetical protein [Altererythrobacter sp. GH1-8]|uniref:hypothetical protein n=1 Tax=Altererythrobacter sp. GH1-8 TaxID=3349333 RepID=UPI00374D5DA6